MSKSTAQQQFRLDSRTWGDANEFKAVVRHWAKKIGVSPARIQIQEMNRKWASCSQAGVVTFSRDLLNEDRSFGEAVIVHELIHLKVPNHGPLFKSLFAAYAGAKAKLVTCNGRSPT